MEKDSRCVTAPRGFEDLLSELQMRPKHLEKKQPADDYGKLTRQLAQDRTACPAPGIPGDELFWVLFQGAYSSRILIFSKCARCF